MNERERIGKRIAELREQQGMTQQQLADASGISQPNVARTEKGKYAVTIDTLSKIGKVLGKQIDFTKAP